MCKATKFSECHPQPSCNLLAEKKTTIYYFQADCPKTGHLLFFPAMFKSDHMHKWGELYKRHTTTCGCKLCSLNFYYTTCLSYSQDFYSSYIWNIVVSSLTLLLLQLDRNTSYWSFLNTSHQMCDKAKTQLSVTITMTTT